MMTRFLDPLAEDPSRPVRIRNRRTGRVVAAEVHPAFDSKTRRRGLLGRASMGPGEGLIIAPCQAIHTWFMKMPIDAAFVARDGRVTAVRPNLEPWHMAMSLRAFSVVELPVGALYESDTRVGDELELVGQ